jgi:signal transduction histidine kinase
VDRILRRGPFSARLLCISSVVDAATCLAALVPNVLWPWPEYRGLLLAPDVTAILLMVSASALRLSRRATQIAIVCNVASATLLVVLDSRLNGMRSDVDIGQIVLGVLWLSTASWIALTMASKARELASQGAIASMKGTFATHNLRALLAGHHDSRTLLSSVTLHADLLARRLTKNGTDAESRALVRALQSDLSELRGFERSIKEHAWGAVVSAGDPVAADPGEAFHAALRIVRTAFPDVRVTLVSSPEDLCVRAVGGSDGLGRALLNLLVNACEGNDRGKATTIEVEVSVAPAEGMVVLVVEDDGPGFPDEHVAAPLERPRTTKENGSGLGLLLVRSFVEASGGTLTLRNGSRGARVAISLPAAAASAY